jgi:hypothetical protein
MQELLSAIALALILEGLMPFIAPDGWKKAVSQLMSLPASQVRVFGFVFMMIGVGLLYLVRS